MIRLKRVYENPTGDDGFRILVDRLWPRGLSKDKAKIDLWMKDISPSDELRKWYHGHTLEWDAFRSQYFHELDGKPVLVRFIADKAQSGPVTLVFAAKDRDLNNGVALLEYVTTVFQN